MAEQQEEGLLEKIHALVAPPQSSSSAKQKGKKTRVATSSTSTTQQQKHGSIENNPFCNACGDGGSLLCCDRCPASFHFYCCDPPVDPKNLPSGEWLCRSCSNIPIPPSTPLLFHPLLEQATSANPLIFNIPEELKSSEVFPGQSKRHLGQRPTSSKATEEKTTNNKLCYACNQRVPAAHLAQCDFCPLHFHLSCVDPPLTTPPTAAWMCPLHPHHSISDFEHPRLSRRLRAVEKGREEVQHHQVKMDFLSKINRIRHYKRVTRHLKRRVTEVPPAVKLLYSDPMPEACETPPLSESLVCAAEVCQWWRGEEERRRREIAAFSSLSGTSLLPSPHHQDKWTKEAVVSQVNQHSMTTSHPSSPTSPPPISTPPHPPTSHHHNTSHADSLHDNDSAVYIAATQLLELSKRQALNRVIKASDVYKQTKQEEHVPGADILKSDISSDKKLIAGTVNEEGMRNKRSSMCGEGEEMAGRVNGLCEEAGEEEEEEGEGEKEGEGLGKVKGSVKWCVMEGMEVDGGRRENGELSEIGDDSDSMRSEEGECDSGERENGDVVTGVDGVTVKSEIGGGDKIKKEDPTEEVMEEEYNNMCAPDLSLLAPRLVQLLASQRLQQLFNNDKKITGSSLPQSNHQLNKSINGIRSILMPQPTKPPLTAECLRSAQSLLCPVSGIGTAYAVHKHVTLVGTGSDADVCLLHYGRCNYLSPRHARVFYNKVTGEYELLNYSDHGSVVDGVLYSCDFSDKSTGETAVSLSPDKAREKIEDARRNLRDQSSARRALEGALSLSKHSGKEEGAGEGTRRTTYNSSVVSIPLALSRNKKLSAGVPAGASPAKDATPAKPGSDSPQQSTPPHSNLFILCPDPPPTPCLCRRSASCLVGSNRKGWEGTATLYHGSRLRFGCLQFVFSIAGRPGHTELVTALSPLLHMTEHS